MDRGGNAEFRTKLLIPSIFSQLWHVFWYFWISLKLLFYKGLPSDKLLFYMHCSLFLGVWYILLVVITELHNQNWKGDGRLRSTTALLKVGSTIEHYSGLCPVLFIVLSRLVILQHLWAICSTVLPPSQYIKIEFPVFQFMSFASSLFTGYHWEESDSIFKPSC